MSLDIPRIILDPENEEEVIRQAYERIQAASDNTLTDFSAGSPIAALIEGQAFVYAELLWFLNRLPEALALEVLRLSGVSRSPGTKARGRLHFLLSAPISSDFILSQGFLVPYKESGYVTTEALVIPAGSLEGSASIEAVSEGRAYNAPGFAIAGGGQGMSYLQSVYNPDPITGGSDLEPLDELLRRSQRALRTRNVLVTAEDYESKAEELLGYGSRATVFPLIAADRITEKAGNVHVFLAGVDGKPPSTETCQTIQRDLKALSFAGASVWVSPVALSPVTVDAVVRVPQLSQGIADDCYRVVADYLSPLQFPLGSSIRIKELEYLVRSVQEVKEVVTLLINSQAVNIPMPNKYTTPELETLALTLVDSRGLSQTYYLGMTDGALD